jgi:hypothetical protein
LRPARLTKCPAAGKLTGMDSHDLTEARVLADRLRILLGYLNRLQTRMAKQGFPRNDKLYCGTRRNAKPPWRE